ncbi:unnamed protein product, partial [Didymodactylos carnosus]
METTKSKSIFIHAGYAYIVDKTSGDKTTWCCDRKRHGQCRGRIHTINDSVVLSIGEHNHEPKAEAAEMIAARTQMASEAKMTSKKTHDNIATDIDRLSRQAVKSNSSHHDDGLLDKILKKKETIEETKKKHEDLEFQLMELETRCEAELAEAEENFKNEQEIVQQNSKIRQ